MRSVYVQVKHVSQKLRLQAALNVQLLAVFNNNDCP